MNNFMRNRVLWLVTTLCTLAAAILGVAIPGFYARLVAPELIPAGYAQDLLTIVVCAALIVLILLAGEGNFRMHVVILGIVGSFFYLYAIFAIDRVYNVAYYLYLAILSLSFWSLVFSIPDLKTDLLRRVSAPAAVRYVSAGFSLLIAAVFSMLWITALWPMVSTGRKAEYLYSVYILDLCLVMPAFLIVAVMVLRKQGLGLLLAPGMFILGIFVIFPLGLGEIAKPFFSMAPDYRSMLMSFVLSAAFLVMSIIHLRSLRA
jgi:hypothetical protein